MGAVVVLEGAGYRRENLRAREEEGGLRRVARAEGEAPFPGVRLRGGGPAGPGGGQWEAAPPPPGLPGGAGGAAPGKGEAPLPPPGPLGKLERARRGLGRFLLATDVLDREALPAGGAGAVQGPLEGRPRVLNLAPHHESAARLLGAQRYYLLE
jgi:hypothetical protein